MGLGIPSLNPWWLHPTSLRSQLTKVKKKVADMIKYQTSEDLSRRTISHTGHGLVLEFYSDVFGVMGYKIYTERNLVEIMFPIDILEVYSEKNE